MDDYLLAQHSSLEWTHWWFQGRRVILEDVLDRYVEHRTEPPLKLLDVGCGAGVMLPALQRLGSTAAMDTAEDAITFCREQFPNVALHVGRVPDDLPPPGSLDVITAFDVLEHIEDDHEAAASIRGALRPGGVFVCSVPAYMSLWGPHDVLNHHQRRYRRKQLIGVLEQAGFELEWSSYFNTFLYPPTALVRIGRRVLKRDEKPGSDFDVPSGAANKILSKLFASERHLLRHFRLPFGVSIVAVARRPR